MINKEQCIWSDDQWLPIGLVICVDSQADIEITDIAPKPIFRSIWTNVPRTR